MGCPAPRVPGVVWCGTPIIHLWLTTRGRSWIIVSLGCARQPRCSTALGALSYGDRFLRPWGKRLVDGMNLIGLPFINCSGTLFYLISKGER